MWDMQRLFYYTNIALFSRYNNCTKKQRFIITPLRYFQWLMLRFEHVWVIMKLFISVLALLYATFGICICNFGGFPGLILVLSNVQYFKSKQILSFDFAVHGGYPNQTLAHWLDNATYVSPSMRSQWSCLYSEGAVTHLNAAGAAVFVIAFIIISDGVIRHFMML